MNLPCFITGTGLVTVQGVGVDANWRNLLAGRVLREKGVVALPFDPNLSRVSGLAIHAAREALAAAGSPKLNDDRTGLVVGTSKGPIEDWIEQLNGRRPLNLVHGIAQVAFDLANTFGHRNGPRLTLAGACASGLLALIRGVELIRQGTCDRVLVVAAEASTHALFEANFRRLGVLATADEGCRPFDVRRRGFLLAEAAAAVVLERTPGESLNHVLIDGTASFADAHHLTGPDPTAAALTHTLLRIAENGPIDLVHAHGTGTQLNDPAELRAINAAFPNRPPIYSHKHAIGHTQGAAGLIAVALDVKAHEQQIALGNSASTEALIDCQHQLSPIEHVHQIKRTVAIAAGFGGSIACISVTNKKRCY